MARKTQKKKSIKIDKQILTYAAQGVKDPTIEREIGRKLTAGEVIILKKVRDLVAEKRAQEKQKKKYGVHADPENLTDYMRQLMAHRRADERTVTIPPVVNPERRERCGLALWDFANEYFKERFYLESADVHREMCANLERVILEGGNEARVYPRGSAKTTWTEIAVWWAALYGYRKFIVIICGTADLAVALLDNIKSEMETNAELAGDFPEVGFPVQKVGGIARRADNMTMHGANGEVLDIGWEWKTHSVTLPKIESSPCCACRILAYGITGHIRGLKKQVTRPDFVVIDDPQTRETAGSVVQVKGTVKTITGDVIGLAGPSRKVACVVNGTIIKNNDAMYQLTDRKLNPAWHGVRVPMILHWAEKHEDMWLTEYAERRKEDQRAGDMSGKTATEYYKANQEAMDKGCLMYWPARRNDDEISGIQHAYNLLIDYGESMFFAEYQNDPKPELASTWEITEEQVLSRLSNVPRGTIPEGCSTLTFGADVNLYGVNWVVVAWNALGAGYVIDWGKYPPGEKARIWTDKMPITEEQAIHSAMLATARDVFARPYMQSGKRIDISFAGFDCGYKPDTVMATVMTIRPMFPKTNFIPVRGFPTRIYRPMKDSKKGDGWHVGHMKNGMALILNTDVHRPRMQKGFLLPVGSPGGSVCLYGDSKKQHAVLAEHVCAEQIVDILTGGKLGDVPVWFQTPGKKNDLADALTYNFGLAAYAGIHFGAEPAKKRRNMPEISEQKGGEQAQNAPEEPKDTPKPIRKDPMKDALRRRRAVLRGRGGFTNGW